VKRTLIAVALLVITAHRLPAPIQEIPEAPTPAVTVSAKPKPKLPPKPRGEATPKPSPAVSFAGTWRGGTECHALWTLHLQRIVIISADEKTLSGPANEAAVAIGPLACHRLGYSLLADEAFGKTIVHYKLQIASDGKNLMYERVAPGSCTEIGSLAKQ
jgi:hypothetical protein